MDDEQPEPTTNRIPPLLFTLNKDAQSAWLKTQVIAIKTCLLGNVSNVDPIRSGTTIHDEGQNMINSLKQLDGTFVCSDCGATYKEIGWLKRHMQKKHDWHPPAPPPRIHAPNSTKTLVISSFVKMALLARDTWDAYRMGDGDRVFRNAKLEMLYAFGTGRTKYRLWLWNMVANELACLTEREAFEYKWNISVNLKGGIGQNIPNDDLCELQVRRIKGPLATQGPNKSFDSAQVLCKTSHVLDQLKEGLQK